MKRILTYGVVLFIALLIGVVSIKTPDGRAHYSTVVYDRFGGVLSANVAQDQQWRFPQKSDIPASFISCILLYEDEYYYWHPGVNPVSLTKALYENFQAGKIVRGGSTITMQVMRMYRGNRRRTIGQKLIEILGAIKMECLFTKNEILKIWSSMAPFGGNTVGASTASRRYFSRPLNQLSWAEYATLAVLPNAPASVHLNRNIGLLKSKRDFLLHKLHRHAIIDSLELALSLSEEVPRFQDKIPQHALHFMQLMNALHANKFEFYSTIDPNIQHSIQEEVDQLSKVYSADGINNVSAIVIDNVNNELLAYVGNSQSNKGHVRYVDCVQSERSYGSLLKPFLYLYALEEGYFLPHEKVMDIPTNIGGFTPKNFDLKHRGQVPFDYMVSQSLNVPAVRTLNYVGMESFHNLLRNKLHLEHLHHDPAHHGLSLILGGAESNLWDLARLYKGLILNLQGHLNPYGEVNYLVDKIETDDNGFSFNSINVEHTLKAMSALERPEEEQNFTKYGGQEIAWKTGTSYGHRDAWSIGTTMRYTVAVWVGNESGEGMFNLTGVKKAAPLLFKIFGTLKNSDPLPRAHAIPVELEYCLESGQLRGPLCPSYEKTPCSKYHHALRQCMNHVVKQQDTIYIRKPIVAHYEDRFYGKANYQHQLADHRSTEANLIDIIYPPNKSVIFIPKKLDQQFASIKMQAGSSNTAGYLYWYLNDTFLGSTQHEHEISMSLEQGPYSLFLVDEQGNEDYIDFDVVRR